VIQGKTRVFFIFVSDFQERVIEEVRSDPYLHLFIDGSFKVTPKKFSQLLNIAVFHREKK
jgi:hypothetical protein